MSEKIEIRNATVIDGTGCAPLLRCTVRIANGKIVDVKEGGGAPSDDSAGTTVIDATGMTVLPGLIDAHCHLSYGEGRSSEEVDIFGGAAFSSLRAAWNAAKMLGSGVTSVCDPGSTWDIAVAVRDAVDTGMYPGPRIVAAGRHITTEGGFGDPYPSWVGTPESSEGIVCSSLVEMVREIRRQVKNRVDVIKISGDVVAKDARAVQTVCMSNEEMQGMVAEAHRLGRKVAIHSRYNPTVRSAIDAGVDWMYHASYATREEINRAADAQIAICPTLTYTANIVDYPDQLGVHQSYVDVKKRELDALGRLIEGCRAAGVRVMSGSEVGFAVTPYGEWHARELELLISIGGMSPMEALVAATKTNAEVLGLLAQTGTLEPGKLADVLIVKGDPLKDIRILQDRKKIAYILKGGKPVPVMDPLPLRHQMPHERNLTISTASVRQADVKSGTSA